MSKWCNTTIYDSAKRSFSFMYDVTSTQRKGKQNIRKCSNTTIPSCKNWSCCVTVLLENNAYVSEIWADVATLLFRATEKDRADVYAVLLENNANVNKIGENDVIQLFMAAQSGYSDVCTMLLENKSNGNGKGQNELAPTFQAMKNIHAEVYAMLLVNNVKKSENGTTPLFMAA